MTRAHRLVAVVLTAGIPLIPVAVGAQSPVLPDTQRVVFVCEHGTVKSVVAAAHFNRLARAQGLRAIAVSRGTAPDSALPAVVREGLLADGVGPWRSVPTLFRPGDAAGAALVVAFDQLVEAVVDGRAPVRRWDGTPSVMRDYATGRDTIVSRVAALVAELRAAQARRPAAVKTP